MFISLSIYQARSGEEDAVLALHEEWQRLTLQNSSGFISGEVLCSTSARGTYVVIVRCESEDAFRRLAAELDRDFWHGRLLSLVEPDPVVVECRTDGRVDRGQGEADPLDLSASAQRVVVAR